MSPRLLSVAGAFALLSSPLWADRLPDFENDAEPILAHQPGLVKYIHTHFEVKETGIARVPGTQDRPPAPPFIFNARPKGASGPFYLRLLIQPGPVNHILKVADIRKLPGQPAPVEAPPQEAPSQPPPTQEPPPQVVNEPPAQPPVQQPLAPPPDQAPGTPASPATAPATSTNTPSADTPSGPIID